MKIIFLILIKTEYIMLFLLVITRLSKIDKLLLFTVIIAIVTTSCNYQVEKKKIAHNYDFVCQDLNVEQINNDEFICNYLRLYGEDCLWESSKSSTNTIARVIDFPKSEFDTLFIFTIYNANNCYYMTCKFMPSFKFSPAHQVLNDPKIQYSSLGLPISDKSYNEIIDRFKNLEFTTSKRKHFFSNSSNTLFEIVRNKKYEYCIQSESDVIVNLFKSKFF